MKDYILAIDIGTSGAKLLLLNKRTGGYFARSEGYPTYTPSAAMAEHDPAQWYEAVKRGVPALLAESGVAAEEICAIGVDGISWTPVPVDENGDVLCRAPIWYDTRASEECRRMDEEFGEDTFFGVSGNPNQPYYIYPKLKWLIGHNVLDPEKIRKVLSCNGYIVYRLTGVFTHDMCQAYGWCFFDMKNGRWDVQLAEKLGVDPGWLPELYECTQIAGGLTAKAADECGLRAGIPVVAGGLDAACGAAGAGVIAPGVTHEQSGSAGGMSICDNDYRPVKGLILSRHVVPGVFLLQGGTVGGGGLVNWIGPVLFPDGAGMDKNARREELTRLAASAPAGSGGVTFLPYMAGERSPIWNPFAKGVWYGLDYTAGRAHMARSLLEGAAYALNHNLEAAREQGISIGMMRAVGGASANALWMQIKADVTGESICAIASPETTATGCAVMAGVGCGEFASFAEAAERFVKIGRVYTPDPANREVYREGYERYLSVYRNLAPMMKG